MDPVRPEIDVSLLRQVPFCPLPMFFCPGLLQTTDGCGREPRGVLSQKTGQNRAEVSGGDPPEVEPRQQFRYAFRSTEVRRENLGRKPDLSIPVPHPRSLDGNIPQPCLDRPFRQITIPHNSLPVFPVFQCRVAAQNLLHFRFHRLHEHPSGSFPQQLCQTIRNGSRGPWILEFKIGILSHGVSTPS